MTKESSNTIRGIFIILIFTCTFIGGGAISGFVPQNTINMFDKPMQTLFGNYEQLLYVPFFFYSGYGIFETFKDKGKDYARRIPLQQILRHFISYFVAWVLFAITALALHSNYSIKDYLLSIVGLSSIGNPTNWFVFVMIILYLVSFVSFRIADKKTAVIIHIVLTIFLYFMFKSFAQPGSPYLWNTMPAYVVGVIYSYIKDRVELKLFKRKIYRFIVLIISAGLLALSLYLITFIPYGDFKRAAFLVPSFFFCVFLISLTSIVRIRSKILNFIGANSFWIFILMQLPMIWLKRFGFITDIKYIYFAVSLIIVVILAFIFNKIFNYIWNIFVKNHGETSEQNNVQVGIAISYIALAVSALGAFVVTPRVIENLGYDQYGLLNFANSITLWLAVINSALSSTYIRFASKYQKENKDVGIINTTCLRIFAYSGLALFAVVTAVVFIFIGFNIQLPQYTFEENRLTLYLIFVSAINVCLNVIFSIFTNFLNYKKQFIFVRLLALFISFLTFACNLIFSFVTKNVLSISIVAVVLTTISSVLTMIYAFKKEKMRFAVVGHRESKPLVNSIMVFSVFILINAIVYRINNELDKTLLGLMANYEAVADYSLAKYFNGYFVVLTFAISSTFVPKIHDIVAKDPKIIVDMKEVKQYYNSLIETEENDYKHAKEEYKSCKNNEDKKQLRLAMFDAKKAYTTKCKWADIETKKFIAATKQEIEQKENKKELSALFLKICRSQMIVLFLFGGGFFSVGKEFMNLWLGADKEYLYYYALLPVALDMFELSITISIEIQRAFNKHKFAAFAYLIIAIMNVGLSTWLIKTLPDGYQVWGALIGTAFTLIVGNIIIVNLYQKFRLGLPIGRYFMNIGKFVLYAGVPFAVAFVLGRFVLPASVSVTARFLIKGVTFVVLYLAAILIFERKTALPLLKKVTGKIKAIAKEKLV